MGEIHAYVGGLLFGVSVFPVDEVALADWLLAASARAISAMKEIAHLMPEHVPIILESVVGEEEVCAEVDRARRALPLQDATRRHETGPVATV